MKNKKILVTGADGWTIWVADACLTECIGDAGGADGLTLPKECAVCCGGWITVASVTGALWVCPGVAIAIGATTVASTTGAPGVACG